MQEFIESVDLNPKATVAKRVITLVICLLLIVILAVSVALLVKIYVVSEFIVDGISMYPTLDGGNGATAEGNSELERTNGEILYLNKIARIKRNDIVVFSPDWEGFKDENGEGRSLVKRVIAVSGDTLRIVEGKVYLNNELLNEPYVNQEDSDTLTNMEETTIPDGYIFCMGDNRNHSADCRAFGPIPLDFVVGKCFLIRGLDGKFRKPN